MPIVTVAPVPLSGSVYDGAYRGNVVAADVQNSKVMADVTEIDHNVPALGGTGEATLFGIDESLPACPRKREAGLAPSGIGELNAVVVLQA